ncbi:polypeptide N-acetylgalactosaminyltransferase 15 isoform X2 [Eublepharis macularius]|uniref:Polypeptide N-acetylgalactosaminyltransferase n=1 Tax=Eublepharis macularius TaxID=481883 RepID=A0AA97K1D0_EUBMA|nr:polypeptide N-acetylgalactosaminyltransferase 15 isoform X2 [Eublepharis macularius]
MLLRKRCRCGSRKLQFLLLLLVLTFFLLMITMRNPAAKHLSKEGTSLLANYNPKEGYQVAFGQPQEILDSQENSQYFPMEGLSPFISLREDELLVAIEVPTAKRNHIKTRKGYRMVRQQSRRQKENKQTQDPKFLLQSLPLQAGEQADAGEQLLIAGLEVHGFNEALSQQIPLHRELPEVRHPLCQQQGYSSNLPMASVVICFHNEAWSTLLRTVHSILDTAPRAFLKEIILVDDLSTEGYLKSSLSEHISKLAGVKLIRSNKRLGVAQGRMLGAARATGDVVVFMDSHCECLRGWLEPLLDRLASDRSRIVSPVIDVIDWKTFQYYRSVELQRGVFDWKLDFHWKPLPECEEKVQLSPISPIRSPTIPGVVVAVDRHYFQNTGGYDSDMIPSGAENLELSIKTWLCGGSVEILPCSHVGHVYRAGILYNFDNEDAIERNKIRIAETWLDSFKDLFYEQNRNVFLISKAGRPNCTECFQLRRRLGCKGFQWFISNVYPELHPVQRRTRFSGKLYNSGVGFCAEYKTQQDAAGGYIQLSPCNNHINQHFEYNGMKEISFGSAQQLCFDVRHEKVVLQNCTKEMEISPQHWDIKENGMIVHILSGKCIEGMKTDLCLRKCNKEGNMIWQFEHSFHVDER